MGNFSNRNKLKNTERLVGWLVSYDLDENGYSFQILSGRTFISKEALGLEKEIEIQDDSLSTPHLVLLATQDHTLYVEDIFSEAGTYYQRGNDTEKQIWEPTELKHGDWLIIGNNIRFQVCLIDGQSK